MFFRARSPGVHPTLVPKMGQWDKENWDGRKYKVKNRIGLEETQTFYRQSSVIPLYKEEVENSVFCRGGWHPVVIGGLCETCDGPNSNSKILSSTVSPPTTTIIQTTSEWSWTATSSSTKFEGVSVYLPY